MVILRTLLVVAVNHGWIIEQLDVNNVFLHGDLNEEVYMQVLQGYSHKLPLNTVFKLKKSLYGLKQANRQCQTFITLLVYVDDILIACNDKSFIEHIKANLNTKFSIKDLGPLHYYSGIEFLRNKDGLALTQRKYALDLVTYFGLLDTKPSAVLHDPNKKLSSDNGDSLPDPSFYKALVRKLLYLTIIRPDLAFAKEALRSCLISWQSKKQTVVSRSSTKAEYRALADSTHERFYLFIWKPCLQKKRFTKVKTASTPIETQKPLLKDENGEEVDVHMHRYLKGQPKLGLWYPKNYPFDLVAYTGSDYAGASLDRKSTTGGYQFLGCRLISWQCMKQIVVANITIEAEYVVASSYYGQVLWIQNQLLDYGVFEMKLELMLVKVNAARHKLTTAGES
ncbi:retrovirus-related pol polyprotein from transposon TNT 1-94 [Tanacetum coccineum]